VTYERRLAGTGAADQREHFALQNREVDPRVDDLFAIPGPQSFDVDDVH